MRIKNKIKETSDSVFAELEKISLQESVCTRGKNSSTKKESVKITEPLDEELLTESIEDIYTRYYSDIDREKFDTIIALDPTFNADQDRLGTYGKWLLAAFKKKNLREPEFRRAREILNDFNERKRWLEKKDIFQYKTLQDIRTALDNIQLTDNQRNKLNRKKKHSVDLGDEAEFVAEDSNWEIWIPKTYNASMKLGSGSTWCTASTNSDYYYNHYTNSGILLIFLKKGNENGEKYQAHISKDGRVTTFMDVTDRPSIDFSDFIIRENLVDVLKGSDVPLVKDNTGITKAENIIRIRNGEPYIYKGERRIDRALIPHIVEIVCDYSGVPEGANVPQHLPAGLFSGATNLRKVTFCPEIKGVHRNVFTNSPEVEIYIPRDSNGRLNFAADPSEFDFYRGRVKPLE